MKNYIQINLFCVFFFFKQKTAYEIRPCDWSSDVCSSDLIWDYDTAHEYKTVNGIPGTGGAIDVAGPVVAGGMLFAVSGYPARGGLGGNVLLAFGVEP